MGKFRILVVDDNPRVRTDYDHWLREFGFEPVVAASIGEAEHKLASNFIHLAIIDVRLSAENENNTDGLKLCRQMDPIIPRIILTGYTDDWRIVREALRIDNSLPRQRLADAFLVKEVDDPEQRLQEIHRILLAEYEIIPKQRFAVLTSGGDAPGMNAALWAIVRTALKHNIEVVGINEGYDGLIRNQTQKLKWNSVSGVMAESGTILLSARSKEFRKEEKRKIAVENVIRKNITGLIVIGGDGSMNGAQAFANEVAERRGHELRTIAIPGTIDNDLHGTDMSLGAASAANAMIDLVRQMVKPAQALRMVFVVEVMGALSGFLALEAAIGTGADAVIIPEQIVVSSTHDSSWKDNVDIEATRVNLNDCLDRIDKQFALTFAAGKRYGFIIQAEGLDRCTRALLEETGQKPLDAKYSVEGLKERFSAWPESIRPEVRMQRLGYAVRGVLPSRFDVWLGATLGKAAVEKLIEGHTNLMVGWSEKEGIITTKFETAVQMSNRSPSSIWADRKDWHNLLELQQTLTGPLPTIS